MRSTKHILLTIDVEDWFQVENFKPWIPFSTWDQRELRVERNVHQLLDLFDSIELNTQRNEPNQPNQPIQLNQPINNQRTAPNKQQTTDHIQTNKIKTTFFVLGWLADRLPNIVRDIQSRGHEIASHGCNHELPKLLFVEKLKQDLPDSKKLLEDITGAEVAGYRAPSFAINDGILKIIEDAGYLYDSSYNSFGLHGRYGKISLNGLAKKGIAHKLSNDFYELPVSNFRFGGLTFPLGGGGYFRLLPFSVFNWGIKLILKRQNAYMFYFHPWEIDPGQPRVEKASVGFKFRHYRNIGKTYSRLRDLIANFNSCNFITCNQYLDELV